MVDRNIASVSITFSKPMNTGTPAPVLTYGWGPSSKNWSADGKTLTLTRNNAGTPLPDGQDIVFILSTYDAQPLRDAGGNALQEYTFSFTTEGNLEQWVKNAFGVDIIQVPADLAKGFYWHYYLSIPKTLSGPSVLYVAPNNTGWPAIDHTYHDIRARRLLYWETQNVFNWQLDAPVLVPSFPRYTQLYLQNLWLDPYSEHNRIVELQRIDLQLIAMIEDAKERLRSIGLSLYDDVLMNGFSASGDFTARFTLLHPEMVRAAAFGGCGGTLPVTEWEGRALSWPEGISNISAITGHPFNIAAYRYVPQFFFVGDGDNFDPTDWERARQIYNSVGTNIELRMYPGVGHQYTDEILADLGNFFAQYKSPKPVESLSVIKKGTGKGTVASSPPGIQCGNDCFERLDHGTRVILTATPDTRSTFAGWSGACSGTGACQVDMDSSKRVIATFLIGKPIISAVPMSVNFGSLKIDDLSAPKPVTVKNMGLLELILRKIEIIDPVSGEASAEFIQTNDCLTTPIVKGLNPFRIDVVFAPALPFGKKNALMRIESNDPKKPLISVKLTGMAPPPKISVAPRALRFGSVGVGNSSPPKTVTIKNTGISDLVIKSVFIEGGNASEYLLTGDCVSEPIPQGGSCDVLATFASSPPFGKKTADLIISSNDPKRRSINVKLSGVSPPPKISATPTIVNFGTVSAGDTSSKTVTITNRGVSDLMIYDITIAGAHESDFTQTNECLTAPIQFGKSCVITLAFSPSATGKKTAAMTITSNDPLKGSVTISLTGTR